VTSAKNRVAVERRLFKTNANIAEAEEEHSALDKYFNRATSKYEEKALEEPHHSENCDHVSSRTDDVMPDSQRGSVCTRSHFGSVESDRSSSVGASDESYQLKFKICQNHWMDKRCNLARCRVSECCLFNPIHPQSQHNFCQKGD